MGEVPWRHIPPFSEAESHQDYCCQSLKALAFNLGRNGAAPCARPVRPSSARRSGRLSLRPPFLQPGILRWVICFYFNSFYTYAKPLSFFSVFFPPVAVGLRSLRG